MATPAASVPPDFAVVGAVGDTANDVVSAGNGVFVAAIQAAPRGAVLYRLGQDLSVSWRRSHSLPLWAGASGLAVGADQQTIYLAGPAGSIPDTVTGDVRLGAFDLDGELQWSVVLDDGGMEYVHGVAANASGVFLVGARGGRAWAARTDLDGSLAWSYTASLEGYPWSFARDAVAEVPGTWVLAGWASTNGTIAQAAPLAIRFTDGGAVGCP